MADAHGNVKVSDDQLLLEFLLSSDPALVASEIAENVPLTATQVTNRLDAMENTDDGEPKVVSKHAAGRRIWWLTPTGREYIVSIARQMISENSEQPGAS
jgi:predicted ArsR family transcriptional regulator